MPHWGKLIPGRLIRRYQRFLADVKLEDGRIVTAHCPNSGSMLGCNRPGSRVFLSRAANPDRRTAYTWEMIRVGRVWVGIHTLRTNQVVEEALREGLIPSLSGFSSIRREAAWGDHTRFDFLLDGNGERAFVEVKNVTLLVNGTAAFPDSVSERGQKHLRELARAVSLSRRRRRKTRGVLVFLIHRSDAVAMRPADEIDPDYGALLRRVVKRGVEVVVLRGRVTPRETKVLGVGELILP
jgi:sugar fermentation stimulation protein A